MIIFYSIITGLVVGSFLNVCIFRMPKQRSIVRPRSYCPKCEHPIPWHDNMPVISFIMLGGRCRFCKAKISLRYIIVELLTALVFALLVLKFGLTVHAFVYIGLCCAMIIATFVDFEIQEIPDEISLGGMVIGLLLSIIFPVLHNTDNRLMALLYSFAGLIVGGASIYIIGIIGEFIFKKEAMGGGDVKLLAMIGSFLGYKNAIFIFFLAPFFGAAVGIYMKLRYKTEIIPYGPYLSLATLVVIIWGERILRALFPYS